VLTEFERTEKQVTALGNRIDAGGADLQQLSAKLSAAGIDVAELASHESCLADRVDEANRALQRQSTNLDKVNKASANNQKLNDISTKATGMGLGMIAAGTASAVPVVAATKQAMTLESAMADAAR
jgi:chromosome segregation ATPase